MNLLKIIFLLSFVTSSTLAQTTNTGAVQLLQESALKTLRDFRDNLHKTAKNKTSDSLLRNTTKLISFTKELNDADQLSDLNHYFEQAAYVFENSDANQKESIVKNINQDLSFKIASGTNGSDLNFGPGSVIFQDVVVNAAVKLEGKNPSGDYSLCWTYFTGIDQESLIKMGSVTGTSMVFVNPYKLTIKLPGYITFWLQDTKNPAVIYKSVPEHLKMKVNDKNIELNFIPLKP